MKIKKKKGKITNFFVYFAEGCRSALHFCHGLRRPLLCQEAKCTKKESFFGQNEWRGGSFLYCKKHYI